MSNIKNIYFLGYSGHAYVAIEVAKANGWKVLGYFDKSERDTNPFHLDYYGHEKDANFKKLVKDDVVFPAIGSNSIRKKLYENLLEKNIKQTVLIDLSAKVSVSAIIEESTLVNAGAIINSLAVVGKACIINSGSIIEHECVIRDFSHVAPGATLAGNVKIGMNCFIGANAVVKEGVTVADDVIIGAGAVVLNNITEKGTWVGNPAKPLSKL